MRIFSYRKLLFFILFLIFAVFLFGQTSKDSEASSGKSLPDEKGILLDGKQNIDLNKEKTDQNNVASSDKEENTPLDSIANPVNNPIAGGFIQLFLALLAVCILAYLVLKFLKKSSKFYGTDDPYLKNVASINIAQGKSIHVITLGEKAYIVGVTDSAINKIGELEDKNLVNAMNLENDKRTSSKKDFASMLSAFIPSIKNETDNPIDKDFFTSQRTRLNNAAQNTKEENK